MAEIKRMNLGNLNPIYERELNELVVHQVKGRRNVWSKGCRHKYPERGEMRVPTVEGEGGAQGERDVRRLRDSELCLPLQLPLVINSSSSSSSSSS